MNLKYNGQFSTSSYVTTRTQPHSYKKQMIFFYEIEDAGIIRELSPY